MIVRLQGRIIARGLVQAVVTLDGDQGKVGLVELQVADGSAMPGQALGSLQFDDELAFAEANEVN